MRIGGSDEEVVEAPAFFNPEQLLVVVFVHGCDDRLSAGVPLGIPVQTDWRRCNTQAPRQGRAVHFAVQALDEAGHVLTGWRPLPCLRCRPILRDNRWPGRFPDCAQYCK